MSANRYLRQAIVLLVISTMTSACGPGRRAAKKRVNLDEITITAKNNPMNDYRAASTKSWEIIHTRVALSFNYKEKTANGQEWIKLHPYFYDTDSLQLDAKGMRIDSVLALENGKEVKANYSYANDKLTLRFNKKYTPTDEVTLHIKYAAMPYARKSGGSAAITDDRGLYFINTDYALPNKPAQIWTQGETESNSHWLPTIDKPNQRTTTQLELTVADSFTTLSNGYLSKQIPGANGMRTDIWIMDNPIQVYAIMFAIGKFSVVEDKEWQGKKINYYVEPQYAPSATAMFRNTPEMVDYFSTITGVPYPWNKYSQVVVRDYVSGAMENTSATLLGEFLNQTVRENKDENFENVVSHELFHQWFGDYVTAESWSNLTLNESFATYGEQLWRAHKYGKASVDELYWNELHTYLNSGSTLLPLVRYYYADREDMFDRVSYQKGACILHYLHMLMGDEAFFASMHQYLTTNALHSAEATNWRLAIEQVTGQDWNWFFNQWYYKGGHPKLDVKYTYDDAAQKLTVTIAQKQEGAAYRLPVKSAIAYGKEKTVTDWNITDRNSTFTYPYKNGVKPLVIPDAGHWVVGEWNEDRTTADWLLVFKSSDDDIMSKFKALRSIQKKMDDANGAAMIDLALHDKEHRVRLKALDMLEDVKASQLQKKWTGDVQYIVMNDGNTKVRAKAFDVLCEWKVTASKPEMLNALNDSSYAVAGSALAAIAAIDADTAYILAKQIMKTQPLGDLQSAIWDIIGKQGKDADISFYEQRAPYVYGNKKIQLAGSLNYYLQNTTSANSFDRGVAVFKNMIKTENIPSYRVSIGSYLIVAAAYYKDKKKTARTNPDQAQAENRLATIKTALDQIINEESSESNKTTYRNYTKSLFGN